MITVKTRFDSREYTIAQAIEKKLRPDCEIRGRLEALEAELDLLKQMCIPVIEAYVGGDIDKLNALPGGFNTFELVAPVENLGGLV